jgi:hypothetical protein
MGDEERQLMPCYICGRMIPWGRNVRVARLSHRENSRTEDFILRCGVEMLSN